MFIFGEDVKEAFWQGQAFLLHLDGPAVRDT